MTIKSSSPVISTAGPAAWFAGPTVAVIDGILEASEPTSVFWLMNGLSAVIASYGLLADSPAVVIGAMVVAMLLGPISGVALGINEGDARLLAKAGRALVGGVVWIFAIAFAVGFIHRDAPLTTEMLSRADTRLFDLIIALAGGAAGAVAVLSPHVGTAVVGVAVATALAPPLAAAGLLTARGDLDLASGALLLTGTNIIGIQFAFSAVFWVGGYRKLTRVGDQGMHAFFWRVLPCLVILAGLALILGLRLQAAIGRSLFESKAQAMLRSSFEDVPGTYIADVRFRSVAGADIVTALVRGPIAMTASEVSAAQDRLPPTPDGRRPHLRVRFVQTEIMTPRGLERDQEKLK